MLSLFLFLSRSNCFILFFLSFFNSLLFQLRLWDVDSTSWWWKTNPDFNFEIKCLRKLKISYMKQTEDQRQLIAASQHNRWSAGINLWMMMMKTMLAHTIKYFCLPAPGKNNNQKSITTIHIDIFKICRVSVITIC